VVVEKGAVVDRAIILNDTWIGPHARVERSILDKNVRVGRGARIGAGESSAANRACPEHLSSGLNVIGKHARIPEGAIVARNVRVGSDVTESLFTTREIGSGSVVQVPGQEGH
jgi:glucose-1-phosphate adenylyltransferase